MVMNQKPHQQIILEADFPAPAKYSDDGHPRENCPEVYQFHLSFKEPVFRFIVRSVFLVSAACISALTFMISCLLLTLGFIFLSLVALGVRLVARGLKPTKLEKREVTRDPTEIQRIRDYCKQLYANTMDNLKEIDKFLERYNRPRLKRKK